MTSYRSRFRLFRNGSIALVSGLGAGILVSYDMMSEG